MIGVLDVIVSGSYWLSAHLGTPQAAFRQLHNGIPGVNAARDRLQASVWEQLAAALAPFKLPRLITGFWRSNILA